MARPRIFVSYSHQNPEIARRIVTDLKLCAASVWFDEHSDGQGIIPGRGWDNEIERGIREADVVLTLLSPTYMTSKYCMEEFQFADQLEKPIIPLMVARCDGPKLGFLRRQWIDFTGDYSAAFTYLLEAIGHHLQDFRVPHAKVCPVCERASETDAEQCPHCGCVYQPTRLGQLANLKPVALQAYLRAYQPKVVRPGATKAEKLALALVQLSLGFHQSAEELLKDILRENPTDAYLWYAYACAGLRGEQPWNLIYDRAVELESRLQKALQFDPSNAQVALFLALLKEDYFLRHGFAIEYPSIGECLNIAGSASLTRGELMFLMKLVPVSGGRVVQLIRAALK